MKMSNNGWMSVHQACRRLHVSRPTLLRLIDEGQLPGYRIGWMIRLRVDDVEDYLGRRAEDDEA